MGLLYRLVGQTCLASQYRCCILLAGWWSPASLAVGGQLVTAGAAGLLLAVAAGSGLAVLTTFFQLPGRFGPSHIRLSDAGSVIILALIWLHGDRVSVFIAFLMVLPIIWTNVAQGIAKTHRRLLEMGQVFRFPG